MAKIIVRSEAGVFVGEATKSVYIKELKDGYITLKNSMNINYWDGAALQDGKIHPTQKPVRLFEWCLNLRSKENDIVLDCFSGSGTTAIACHNLKRRFICIEKDPEYAEKSRERLKQAQRQLNLF